MKGVAENTTGGFIESEYNEFLIRNISRPTSIKDIANIPVAVKHGFPLKIKGGTGSPVRAVAIFE